MTSKSEAKFVVDVAILLRSTFGLVDEVFLHRSRLPPVLFLLLAFLLIMYIVIIWYLRHCNTQQLEVLAAYHVPSRTRAAMKTKLAGNILLLCQRLSRSIVVMSAFP